MPEFVVVVIVVVGVVGVVWRFPCCQLDSFLSGFVCVDDDDE